MNQKSKNVYLIDSNEFILYLVKQTQKNDTLYLNKKNMSFSFLFNLLFKFHLSKRVNQFISLPFRWIWFVNHIKKQTQTINTLIVHARLIEYYEEINLMFHLKKILNPKYIFIYYSDSIAKHKLNIDVLKSKYTALFSYSLEESIQYNVLHWIHPYALNQDKVKNLNIEYDIIFVGQAKNRLSTLHETFYALKKMGYRVLFVINKVENSLQLNHQGIVYNKVLSYEKNVDLIRKSHAILEIIDPSNNAPTLRLQEAIYFNKTLVTNVITKTHKSLLNDTQYIHLEVLVNQPKVSLKCLVSVDQSKKVKSQLELDDFSNNLTNEYKAKFKERE